MKSASPPKRVKSATMKKAAREPVSLNFEDGSAVLTSQAEINARYEPAIEFDGSDVSWEAVWQTEVTSVYFPGLGWLAIEEELLDSILDNMDVLADHLE